MLSAVAPDRSPENAIPSVTPGVFFGAPVALPRGPHALPRADVLAEQRERLMAAMTDLIAAGGYTRVTLAPLFAEEVYLGIVYVARQLACDALEEQRRPNLRGIGEILAPWLLTVYRPDALARPAVSRVPSRRRSAR